MSADDQKQCALSIEHVQRLGIAPSGTPTHGRQLYIKIFEEFVSSGLAKRLGGNATLLLLAMGLHAGVLGDPKRRGAKEEFDMLHQLGIVTEQDLGQLFTFVGRETLAAELGMDLKTISAHVQRLIEAGIVEKRTNARLRLTNGQFGSDLYIIRPESFIGRFGSSDIPSGKSQRENFPLDGDQRENFPLDGNQRENFPLEKTGKNAQPEGNFPSKGNFSTQENFPPNNNVIKEQEEEYKEEHNAFNIIQSAFAQAIGATSYTLTEKEQRQLNALLSEGYTIEDIARGVRRAAQEARDRGQRINFSYCVPVIRRVRRDESKSRPFVGAEGPGSVVGNGSLESNDGQRVVQSVAGRLDHLAGGNPELRALLELVQERNPRRVLGSSDVQAWLAIGAKYSALAQRRGISPVELLRQAVLHGIGAQSDRDGYFNATLADAILAGWAAEPPKTNLPARRNGNGNGTKSKYPDDNGRFAGVTP